MRIEFIEKDGVYTSQKIEENKQEESIGSGLGAGSEEEEEKKEHVLSEGASESGEGRQLVEFRDF